MSTPAIVIFVFLLGLLIGTLARVTKSRVHTTCVVPAPAVKVVVRPRYDHFVATCADNNNYWGCGKSRPEAIGDLVVSEPELFNLAITYVPNNKSPVPLSATYRPAPSPLRG